MHTHAVTFFALIAVSLRKQGRILLVRRSSDILEAGHTPNPQQVGQDAHPGGHESCGDCRFSKGSRAHILVSYSSELTLLISTLTANSTEGL